MPPLTQASIKCCSMSGRSRFLLEDLKGELHAKSGSVQNKQRQGEWGCLVTRGTCHQRWRWMLIGVFSLCTFIEFHMPPICSLMVRPGRPAEAAAVLSKQLSNTILSYGMINLKELCLIHGKAAWMAYLDIYCLDADGALFDAALLSAIVAFSYFSLTDNGKIVVLLDEDESRKLGKELVNSGKKKLTLNNIPFSLTYILYKNYILVDPIAEEESIIETLVTVVLDSSARLVSFYKPVDQFLPICQLLRTVLH